MWIAEAQGDEIGPPVVLIVLLIAGVIYGFGYVRAVMHRANTDYKSTKAAVPVLRSAFWKAWRSAFKFVLGLALIAFILFSWMVHDAKENADQSTPVPSPSVSKSHR